MNKIRTVITYVMLVVYPLLTVQANLLTNLLKTDESHNYYSLSVQLPADLPLNDLRAREPALSEADKKRLAMDFCHLLAQVTGKQPQEVFNTVFQKGMDELTLTDTSYTLKSFFKKMFPTFFSQTQLSLQKPSIAAHFPEIWNGILTLTWLKNLTIIGIPLENVQPSVVHLQNLRTFILSDNDLSSPLPEALSTLPYLEHLVVSDNKLTSLPRTLSHAKNLKYISFRGNQLTAISEEMARNLTALPQLTTLNLADNKLTDISYTLRLFMQGELIL